MRQNHALTTENHGSHNGGRHIQILHFYIGQRGFFLDLGFKKTDLTIGEVLNVKGCRYHENTIYFHGHNQLRVQHKVYIKVGF